MAGERGWGRRERARASHRPALVAYAVVTAVFLWPAVRHFRTRPMLGSGDGSFFYWAWWSMPRALAEGRSPFDSPLLFHPVGVDLRLSTLAPLPALLTAPVRFALGPAAQVNATQLLAAWSAAVVAYLLLDRVWSHRGAAFVGGFAYSFSAFRFVHAPGHLNLVSTVFLPLGVLLLLRLVEAPSIRRGALLGAALGAAFLTDPQIAVLTLVCLVPVAVHHREPLRSHARLLVAAAVVALVGAAPLLVPVGTALRTTDTGDADSPVAEVTYSSDPTLWLVPPVEHPVLGSLAAHLAGTRRSEGVAYPGLAIVALAIVAAVIRPVKDRAMWAGMALLGFVLSLGPYVSYPGGFYRIPLPFMWVRSMPLLSAMRVPGRFALVGVLGLAALAAGALAGLPRRRGSWILVVGALLAVELLPHHPPAGSLAAPAPYAAIRSATGEAAVLEIPLQWSTGTAVIGDNVTPGDDSVFLAYATEHGHPIVNGVASRFPEDRLTTLLAVPAYRQVLSLQHDPGFTDAPDFDAADLAALDIGFVVYHRDRPMPDVLRYIESLHLPVLADDGVVVVWAVR